MCGRYTRKPRFNIAPGQIVEAIRLAKDGQQELFQPTWGLVVSWMPSRLINARAETVTTKPTFRAAFKGRRCILPADGFYEWQKIGDKKQPQFITLKTGEPFGFAGLWEAGEPETCTIITTTANDLIRPIHERMPVILRPEDFPRWLDASTTPEQLMAMLKPIDADKLTTWPVSPRVNSAKADDASLIRPVEPTGLF